MQHDPNEWPLGRVMLHLQPGTPPARVNAFAVSELLVYDGPAHLPGHQAWSPYVRMPPGEGQVSAAVRGTGRVAVDSRVPVLFGVLTTDTLEQGVERAGSKAGNKGFDAAAGGIEKANLLRIVKDGLA